MQRETVCRQDLKERSFRNVLQDTDLGKVLSKQKYQRRLKRYQARLAELHRHCHAKGISSVIVFEGWDAAGKGGTIRRITYALDPRQYQVIRIAAPSDEELSHHYLWRFWRHIPRAGKTTIYDRSWYGRVLVERVEGYTGTSRWRQAYDEINDFEQALVEHGTVVCKFWLHLSPEEQLRPLQASRRSTAPSGTKSPTTIIAIAKNGTSTRPRSTEMIARTDTSWAPWRVIAAEDKRYARRRGVRNICVMHLKSILDRSQFISLLYLHLLRRKVESACRNLQFNSVLWQLQNQPSNTKQASFSSGPCPKRPGWSAAALDSALVGRSHRSKAGKARLKQAIEQTRSILGVPQDYLIRDCASVGYGRG